MSYKIKTDECTACGACGEACPASCISDRGDGIRVINGEECVSCGMCTLNVSYSAFLLNSNVSNKVDPGQFHIIQIILY